MWECHGQAALPPPDFLTYVPGRPARDRARGYCQTALLADEVYRASHGVLPKPLPLLVRVKDTPHQYGLSPAQRRANVLNAFAMRSEKISLEGGTVLLIDDVVTTGSTVSECARLLLMAGAHRVDVLAFAKAPSFSAKMKQN